MNINIAVVPLAGIILVQAVIIHLEPGFYKDGSTIAERATDNKGVNTPVPRAQKDKDGLNSIDIAKKSTVAIRRNNQYLCSGSLVKHTNSDKFGILTLLSCVDSLKANELDQISIAYGQTISQNSPNLKIDGIVIQQGKTAKDIPRLAVIGLKIDQLPKDLLPIPIRKQNTFIRYGHYILFSGYGESSNNKKDIGESLKFRELYYSDPTRNSVYPEELFTDIAIVHRDDEKIVQNGEQTPRKDGVKVTSCKGDTGSPAIDISFGEWSIFAIKEQVNFCEAPRNYAIDLRFHQEWIDKAITHVNDPSKINQINSIEYIRPGFKDFEYVDAQKSGKPNDDKPLPKNFWEVKNGNVNRFIENGRRINESDPQKIPVQIK